MRALPAFVFGSMVLVSSVGRAQVDPANSSVAPAAPSAAPGTAATTSTQTPNAPAASTTAPAPSSATSSQPTAVHRSSVPGLGNFSFEPTAAEKKRAEIQAKAELEVEEEKPRNGIVRLPGYQVNEDRPPVFTKKQLDTVKGLRADAVKKYISPAQEALNFVHLPSWLGGSSNEDIAMDMYHDQLRLDTRRDLLHEASQLQSAGDNDSATELRQQSQDLYLRPQSAPTIPTTGVSR